jgi:hypothetical protein
MTTPTAKLIKSIASAAMAALSLAVSVIALPATAASTQSFQISPPTANYAANPGGQSKGTIKVTNLTDTQISLKLNKQNFVAKGEEGEIELVDNGDPLYSLAPWFNLIEPNVDIPARATVEVHYLIDIPANAEPGGRYGTIIFSSAAPKLPQGVSGATVQQDIAGIVFQRINGAASEHLDVVTFSPENHSSEYGPVLLNTRLKNTGTVHEKATGTITIKNMFGFQVAKFPLEEHFVIPGSIRHLKNTWPSGKSSQWLFGSYTADLSATYASGLKLSASTSFIIFPWKIILAVIIAFIVLFVVFWRGRKRLARAGRILAGRE